jgi:hypothetical protein
LAGARFDASLLKMTGHTNDVVISEGIQRLGGDDFDEAIVGLVLAVSKLREVDAQHAVCPDKPAPRPDPAASLDGISVDV